LASLRTLFFAKPGKTLGMTEKTVYSQATYFDPSYPDDAQFVENVMWSDKKVVFVTFNMPGGSNNDLAQWTAPFTNDTAQTHERTVRSAANIRWLQTAFKYADRTNAKAMVIALQADMWDPEALPAVGGAGLDQYTPFVHELATQTNLFHRPVLLLNGDTHLYQVDRPLAKPNSPTGLIHKTPPVSNLLRIVVQGSTNPPAEWLRLTINPESFNTFDWSNVKYCDHPDIAC
jgi:hypothetical protein